MGTGVAAARRSAGRGCLGRVAGEDELRWEYASREEVLDGREDLAESFRGEILRTRAGGTVSWL